MGQLILVIIALWLVCCTFYLIYSIVNMIRKAILHIAYTFGWSIYDKEKDNRYENLNKGFGI